MRLSLSATLASFLVLSLAGPASGAKLRVPKAYGTIQAALDAAGFGDVVEVSKGTYSEDLTITQKSGVTLRARGKDKVIVKAVVGPALAIEMSAEILVKRIRFRGGVSLGVLIESSNAVSIRNCRFKEFSDAGVRVDDTSLTCLIEGCKIAGTKWGVHLREGMFHTVRGCTFESTTDWAVILGSGVVANLTNCFVADNEMIGCYGGVGGFKVSQCEVVGNRVVGSELYGVFARDDCSAITVRDCVVKNAGHSGILMQAPSSTIHDNRSKGALWAGIRIDHACLASSIVGNKSKKNGQHGFAVYGTLNVFTGNHASQNGGLNLFDPTGQNSYSGNDF